MSSSTDILNKINEIQRKQEKLDTFATSLAATEINTAYKVNRDTSKMDGDKYKEHHEEAKKLVTTCAKDIESERDTVVASLKAKSATYGIQLIGLRLSYQAALIREENERQAKAKAARDKAAKSKTP